MKLKFNTMRDVVSQTIPLSFSGAVECICALGATTQFKLFDHDQVIQAAGWSAVFSVILFIPFVLRGFLQVTTTLIAKADKRGDYEDVWRITKRTIKFGFFSSLVIGLLFLVLSPLLIAYFWKDISFELIFPALIVVCAFIPIGSFSKTLYIACRAVGKVNIPTTITITFSILGLLLNTIFIPKYGLYGAVGVFVFTQYVCIQVLLFIMLKLGKMPIKIVKGVKEEREDFKFHLRKATPEIGAHLTHNLGSLCLTLASGMVSAQAMLASSIFLDIVDTLCAIGVVSSVMNAISARGEKCLLEGIVSIGLISAILTTTTVLFIPNIAQFMTNDQEVIDMLASSGALLLFYIIVSNEADVVGGYLRGNLMNEAAGGWSMVSMILLRCILPFFMNQFGFIGVVGCHALNRFSLLIGFSVITFKNHKEIEDRMIASASS